MRRILEQAQFMPLCSAIMNTWAPRGFELKRIHQGSFDVPLKTPHNCIKKTCASRPRSVVEDTHVDTQEWGQFLDMPNSAEKSLSTNDAVQGHFLYHPFARSLPQ